MGDFECDLALFPLSDRNFTNSIYKAKKGPTLPYFG